MKRIRPWKVKKKNKKRKIIAEPAPRVEAPSYVNPFSLLPYDLWFHIQSYSPASFSNLSLVSKTLRAAMGRTLASMTLNPRTPLTDLPEIVQRYTNLRSLDLSALGLHDEALACLASLPRLTNLDLSYTKVKEGLAHLENLNLRALSLARCRKSRDLIHNTGFLAKFTNLKYLNLNGALAYCTRDKRYLNFDFLKNLTELVALDLSCTRPFLYPEISAPFAALTNLRSLSLAASVLTVDFSFFRSLTGLVSLDLSRILASPGIVKNLSALTQLEMLDLSLNHGLGSAEMEDIYPLQNLCCLRLAQTCVGNAGLPYLVCLPRLSSLNIRKTPVTNAGIRALHGLPSLKHLFFEGNSIFDSSAPLLREMDLHSLCIRNCSTGRPEQTVGDQLLTELSSSWNLTKLELRCGWVTNDGLKQIGLLLNLTDLSLQDCKYLTDEGVSHLKLLVNLQHLNLRYCEQITNNALFHFQRFSGLTSLNLWGCWKITNNGLRMISEYAPYLTKLQVSLYCCTNPGIAYLTRLPLVSLSLNFKKSKVDEIGIRMIGIQIRTLRLLRVFKTSPEVGDFLPELRAVAPDLLVQGYRRSYLGSWPLWYVYDERILARHRYDKKLWPLRGKIEF